MRYLIILAAACALSFVPASAAANNFKDPLEVPSSPTRLTTSTQLAAVTLAGKRLVAVGIRGLIITSDDKGASWIQRQSPVSSDLLAVHFPTEGKGWAVGHDGVILHSADNGRSWTRQFDGRAAATQLEGHFLALAATGDADGARLLAEMKLNYGGGPEQALLDVWFSDALNGFVCGSFGTILATSDGGKTWQSWIERVEYGSLLHLNALRGIGGEVYVASEKGIVFKLDRERQRFAPLATGYAGSFFSLAGHGNTVIAAGLRGTVYRSADAGKSWAKVETGLLGAVTASDSPGPGRMLLVSQGGDLLLSTDDGLSFQPQPVPRPTLFSGVVQAAYNKVVLVGLRGVQQVGLR
ncbi:MAG: YCF48-related protein [Pseudomonadota bacterium]